MTNGNREGTRLSEYGPEDLLRSPEVRSDDFIRGELGSYMRGTASIHIVMAAVNLDLFSHTSSPITSAELCSILHTDPDLTEMLCGSLVQLNLLIKNDDTYINSKTSGLYLDSSSPAYQKSNLETILEKLNKWNDLENRLRNGPEYRPREQVMGEKWLRSISESCMGGGIGCVVDEIAKHVDLSAYRTFMDLAGGHGLYTIAICHRYPNLKGYVFDQPMMREIAEENFRRYGKDIEYIAGDFYKDEIGVYDIVFSSFNLATTDIGMCDKVFDSVADGGLLILRRHTKRTTTDQISNLEWSLNTWDGKGKKNYGGCWLPTAEQYVDRLIERGMNLIHRADFDAGSELIILKKPT